MTSSTKTTQYSIKEIKTLIDQGNLVIKSKWIENNR